MYYNVKDGKRFENRKKAKDYYGGSVFKKKLKSRELTFDICPTTEKQ